ncbi:MAG TPA: DUF2846 domain-containing protein [Rhizomicrobium sp.]|nr:DUF2846 domain-containing protein [Rhizomicrobium sp.]
MSRSARAAAILLAVTTSAFADDRPSPQCPGEPGLTGDLGRLYLYRKDALGMTNKPDILVDGKNIGAQATLGEYYCLTRPAGSHTIGTTDGHATTVQLASGKAAYVRFVVEGDQLLGLFSSIEPEAMGEQQAIEDISFLDYHRLYSTP